MTKVRLRKALEPKQKHIIPDIPIIPWENKQDRVENRLIKVLDKKVG